MTRIWKCDSCGMVMDDTPPVAVQLMVILEDDDGDDDPEFDTVEQQFCGLTCLATWSMNEALTHPEGSTQ